MRNIKLVLEYDGTDFSGWQVQPRERTVQGVLEQSLEQVIQERVKTYAAGRTDSGVHALGQVVNFHTRGRLDPASICRGLNACLPRDVRVLQAEEVAESFHARFDAVWRTYRYVISRRARAVGRQYAWFCKYPLDMERIRAASAHLRGKHAFQSFSKVVEHEPHYMCNVKDIEWREEKEELIFEITANRFLHHMVRLLVGTMVEVGRGKIPPERIRALLQSGERDVLGFTVPPHGLFLLEVTY